MRAGHALRQPRLAQRLARPAALRRLSGSSHDDGSDSRVLRKLGGVSAAHQDWERDIAPALARVEHKVVSAVDSLAALRADVPQWSAALSAVQAIASSGSKHLLRPQLVLLGFASGAGEPLEALKAPPDALVAFAAAVELQHLFMFVHDDLMDHAAQRRGQDTVHVALQRQHPLKPEAAQHLATLVGDVLHAKSAQLLAHAELDLMTASSAAETATAATAATAARAESAADVVHRGALRAGAAQFDDVLGWEGIERALDGVAGDDRQEERQQQLLVRLLEDKASFHGFAAPLLAGLRLGDLYHAARGDEAAGDAGEARRVEDACEAWARHAGAAFQALDDVMDLVLESKDSGKDRLQDIQEGRLSLPLFLLRQRAAEDEWAAVADVLGSQAVMAPAERHMLLKLLAKYRLHDACFAFVRKEIDEARAIADAEPVTARPLLQRGLGLYVAGLDHLCESLSRLHSTAP